MQGSPSKLKRVAVPLFLIAILKLTFCEATSSSDHDVSSVDGETLQRRARFIESDMTPYSPDGSLTFDNSHFVINGTRLRILSGAIHYFRTVPKYWRDRLTKLKACGLNTVERYSLKLQKFCTNEYTHVVDYTLSTQTY